MNPAMQDQYTTFLLKRNWKSAVQVLKAALEVDPGDAAALNQLEDQRTRFFQAANSLIEEARGVLSNGQQDRLSEMARRFDSQCPEWSEFTDDDEILVGLWSATRVPVSVPEEPDSPETDVPQPDEGKPPAAGDREGQLKALLSRADRRNLEDFDRQDLLILEKQLTEAEVGFALGVKTGSVTKREVSAALSDVRAAIGVHNNRAVFRNVGVGLVVALLMILAGVYYVRKAGSQAGETDPSRVESFPSPAASP